MNSDLIIKIYALLEPDGETIRYIGKTQNAVSKRYREHLSQTKDNDRRSNWIKSLKNKNVMPAVETIDEVPFVEWEFWERHYISLYRSWGFDLVNGTNGGGGNNGLSVDARKKIGDAKREYFKNPDARKKTGQYRKGIKHTDESKKIMSRRMIEYHKNNPNAGYDIARKKNEDLNNNPQKRLDLSKKAKDRAINNPQFLQHLRFWGKQESRIEASKQAHQRAVIKTDLNGNFLNRYDSLKIAADEGFNIGHISNCCRGSRKTHGGFIWKFEKVA